MSNWFTMSKPDSEYWNARDVVLKENGWYRKGNLADPDELVCEYDPTGGAIDYMIDRGYTGEIEYPEGTGADLIQSTDFAITLDQFVQGPDYAESERDYQITLAPEDGNDVSEGTITATAATPYTDQLVVAFNAQETTLEGTTHMTLTFTDSEGATESHDFSIDSPIRRTVEPNMDELVDIASIVLTVDANVGASLDVLIRDFVIQEAVDVTPF